jgi:HlyD family secretion protein
MRRPGGRIIILILIIAGALLIAGLVFRSRASNEIQFVTIPVSVGSIRTVVSATGTVEPVVRVDVGAQISGQIKELYADFNTIVKQGQLLAKIDPRNFQAQVTNAQAKVEAARSSVNNAEAQRDTAIADVASAQAGLREAQVGMDNTQTLYKRALDLSKQGLISQNDLDAARTNADAANAKVQQAQASVQQTRAKEISAKAQIQQMRAQLNQAEADLRQAQVNLGFTDILSPIDGVIIARNVDVGQTIAASLQAPTLFTIANDLTKMQVNASIDEADIGHISRSAQVRFTVDAYPSDTFTGRIHEVRLNPTTVQNVVTYVAVIDIDNPELKLKPGMTANITITVDQRNHILKIPNAALRYAPPGMTPVPVRTTESGEIAQAPAHSAPLPESREVLRAPGQKWNPQEKLQVSVPPERKLRSGKIWLLNAQGQPEDRSLVLGITDGSSTEVVTGSIREGDAVIVGDSTETTPTPSQNRTMNPFIPFRRGRRR